jgi:hypothetical protein
MVSDDDIQGPPAALLSVVSAAESTNLADHEPLLPTIAGLSVLEWQLAALQKSGVTTCFVEVDNVSGSLLKISDAGARYGLNIQFVRTLEDLQKSGHLKSRLIILAEGHYFSEEILEHLMGLGTPCVATFDIGNESAPFERIDLTRCWAGYTLLDIEKLGSIPDIPEGWSIASTLLRFAVQTGTPFVTLPQSTIQNSEIAKITGVGEAQAIGQTKMQLRINAVKGWIERKLFGRIALAIAPFAWTNADFAKYANLPAPFLIVLSLALTAMDQAVISLLFILLALALHQIQALVSVHPNAGVRPLHDKLFWAIATLSTIYIGYSDSTFGLSALTFTIIMLGLAVLAHQNPLPRWVSDLLCSPTLLVIGMTLSAYYSEYASGVKIIVFAQLALLLTGQYLAGRRVGSQKQP